MPSCNKTFLMGNLTRDPNLKSLPSGSMVCDLGLAVNERTKKDGEWVEEVSFFDVTVWGKQGENCAEYLAKGRSVFIEGKLKQDTWEQDGQKRSKLKVVAQNVQFLGGKE